MEEVIISRIVGAVNIVDMKFTSTEVGRFRIQWTSACCKCVGLGVGVGVGERAGGSMSLGFGWGDSSIVVGVFGSVVDPRSKDIFSWPTKMRFGAGESGDLGLIATFVWFNYVNWK